MAEIKCPMCSKPNPDDLDVCQFCDARLKPLTADLSDSQRPIRAGDDPKEIDTSQLESELPEWLREVRQQSRDSVDAEPEEEPAEQTPPQAPVEEVEEVALPEEPPDLLAGLQSQAEDDEEIPDWLTGLRGESVQTSPEEDIDDDLAAQKSTLGEESTESGEDEASELPDWFADIGTDETEDQSEENGLSDLLADQGPEEEPAPTEGQPDASESEFEWGADFEAESDSRESLEDDTPIDTELPDWLKGVETGAEEEPGSELPDWTELEESTTQAIPPAASEETPETTSEGEIPNWIASLGQETDEDVSEGEEQPVAETDTQEWLASLSQESAEVASEDEGQPATEVEEEGMPDWLASMGEGVPEVEEVSEELDRPALTREEPAQAEEEVSPEISAEDSELTPAEAVDDLFSVDMPDWLSDAETQDVERQALETPSEDTGDDLRPAELPSWVQAMRPVEAVISETEGEIPADQPVEEEGPLAGLRGVLPTAPGIGPTSKPEAYSIKLQASEDQQTSAAMLEQMLESELHPKPITTQPVALPQRLLRWTIAMVLFLVVGGAVFSGMQINPIPSGVPPATKAYLEDYVQGSLPANAPILMIFDYDAALAGELEASAAPLIDYMIIQKGPRLSLISSNPLGPGLAERFMGLENTQASTYYQSGQQFINLGYLPGGPAGVLAFAEDPVETKPYSIDGEDAWGTPVLQGVSRLSDFSTIILLTDNLDTARIWIEQTEIARGDTNFLVVSSAQSGPMLLPYHQSGQVDVMLTGLDGGAPIEQFNSGRPGTARRYWDAYSMGLLAALVMISFGSLWSLLAVWRERSKDRGQG